MEKNMSYCSYFWSHICIRPNSKVQPCCRFDDESFALEINSMDGGSILNNDQFKSIRRKVLLGEKISGCDKCYRQEQSGILSLRQIANSKFGDIPFEESPKLRSLEIFLGDLCNLKCVMCNPSVSSKWREDYKKLNWSLPNRPEPIDFLKILETPDSIREIKFVGGEPMMSNDHLRIIRYLSSKPEISNQIKLTYSSNGTIFPSEEIRSCWKNFKKITFFISIDGVGKVNSYIRYPSLWDIVERNAIKFADLSKATTNMEINILTTVSILNVWSLIQIESWFAKQKKNHSGFNCLGFNPLVAPDFLSIQGLPSKFKKKLSQDFYGKSDLLIGVSNWLNASSARDGTQKLKEYLGKLDSVRQTQYIHAIPELKDLLFEN